MLQRTSQAASASKAERSKGQARSTRSWPEHWPPRPAHWGFIGSDQRTQHSPALFGALVAQLQLKERTRKGLPVPSTSNGTASASEQ